MGAVEACLRAVPGLQVKLIESSCCGMAGSFGYQAETLEFPARWRKRTCFRLCARREGDLIIADGTSCRHQIADGASREALHVVRVLDQALANRGERRVTRISAVDGIHRRYLHDEVAERIRELVLSASLSRIRA